MSCILAQQSFYLKTKTFSDDCFKSIWQGLRLPMFCTATNPRLNFSLFQLMGQKNKVRHRIKFNQEIFTKLLKTMHQLSINLLCSSDYRTTYSISEIKHFVKQAKNLSLRVPKTVLFTDLIYHLWRKRHEQFYGSEYFLDWSEPG